MTTTVNQICLTEDANKLLRRILLHYNPEYGLGNMSPSIYDTAWVSMIWKDNRWLFPSAFQYILDHQSPSGGWESPSSPIDTILNTLSSLLALKYHSVDGGFADLISRAESFLSSQLRSWDIHSTERVGFEIIVPSLLSALSVRGIDFSFPGRSLLMDLNKAKLSTITPQTIYEQHTPILHSLEGLIGYIDFDKVAHHKHNGNFMASPSSTAAYLMHASVWDVECEAYLNEVLLQCEMYGMGSVPSAWPTTFFEISWVVCTLHDAGFNFDHLDKDCLAQMSVILKQGIEKGKGIVGFASGVLADADDTAKVVTALHHLGIYTPVGPLCDSFEVEAYFQCYPFERNSSITVHCNILLALLEAIEFTTPDNMPNLTASILKAVSFISETWWITNGPMEDKWHTSCLYPLLLVSQCLTKFMHLFDKGYFAAFPHLLVQTKTPIALFQILIRILQAQQIDSGSWGSCEETAYAIIALMKLSSLPFVSVMNHAIQAAICVGRSFLLNNACDMQDTKDGACLWIDKVSYRIAPISYSYVLAALFATALPIPAYTPAAGEISRLVSIPHEKVHKFQQFYSKMPMFHGYQEWQILAYIGEGFLYGPILEEVRTSVFGREGMSSEPYMEYIPFTWTSAGSMLKTYSSPQNCFVCMTISLINYQVDEFFDSMVHAEGPPAFIVLRKVLDDIFHKLNQDRDIKNMDFNGLPFPNLVRYLHKYICFIIYYPTLQRASYYDQTHQWRELKAYLLGMIQQVEDNISYAAQTSWQTYLHPKSSYLKWMRTLSSEHISGLCSCAFFLCHLSPDTDVFPTPELKYIAQDCITHISVLCRMWNDWGSTTRDIAERNINGMNFPEFAGMNEQQVKAEMRRISEYERRLLRGGLEELRTRAKEVMGESKGDACVNGFELFIRGAEVYNAVYEFKDISAWRLSLGDSWKQNGGDEDITGQDEL